VVLDTISAAIGFWVPSLGRADTREWTIDGALMAERAGLFIMIALGESILLTGVGFTALEWTPDVVLAMAVALLQSIAMWTIYFGQHARLAGAAIARSSDPGAVARVAYTYVPMLLVAGIIVAAVGDELTIAHPMGHMDVATTLVLIGGPALFLCGAAMFKLAVFGTWSGARLVGLVALVALYPFAEGMTPVLLSAATTAIIVLVAAYEMVWLARHREFEPANAEEISID